jgi:hypothetical protein
MHVDEPARNGRRWNCHRRLGNRRVNVMSSNEIIDHIEISFSHPVEHRDPPILDVYGGLWIGWA